jgi:4-hydroxybenzoate polyprenyltransferase
MLSKVNLKYAWPSQYPGLLLLCLIVGFIGSLAFVTQSINNLYKVILGFTAGFIAINYNIQIFGFRLRSGKGLKSFTIAAVSVITAILIPVATKNNLNLFIGLDFILFTLAQFFFITSLCIAADIRDMAEDKEDAIKTFPVAAGIELSKKFILILLLLNIVLLIILNQRLFLNMQQLECLLLVSMLAMIISFQINPKNSFYYFILIIDGVIALQALSILITNF